MTTASSSNPKEIDFEIDEDYIQSKENFFDSPRKVFIVWAIFVVLLNIFTPYGKKPQEISYMRAWPPARVMRANVDNNNRVVVALSSFDHIEMTDNFLASLERSNVFNFVVVPLDYKSYQYLSLAYPGHILPPMPTKFDENGDPFLFNSIVTSRPNILHAFLHAGYTIFYSDVDSVWRKNAFIEVDRTFDAASHWGFHNIDAFFTDDTRPDNEKQYSAAHLYLKPSIATLSFLESWFHMKSNMFLGDYRQSLHQLIKHNLVSSDTQTVTLRLSGKEMTALVGEKAIFPPGWMYFGTGFKDTFMSTRQKNGVAIVHNNFVKGYENKIKKFIAEGLWNPSGRLPRLRSD